MSSRYPWKVRLQTFWYYFKWYVIAGVIVLISLIPVFKNLFGIGVVEPDYRVACVTAAGLSDATVQELTAALEAKGEDLNGDGKTLVELVQYTTGAGDRETVLYFGYASTITIQADISEAQSQYFLVDDPERFQIAYQILADADGKLPEDTDYSADGRSVPFSALRLELSDAARQELSSLYFGQRGYYDETKIEKLADYRAFWKVLTKQ